MSAIAHTPEISKFQPSGVRLAVLGTDVQLRYVLPRNSSTADEGPNGGPFFFFRFIPAHALFFCFFPTPALRHRKWCALPHVLCRLNLTEAGIINSHPHSSFGSVCALCSFDLSLDGGVPKRGIKYLTLFSHFFKYKKRHFVIIPSVITWVQLSGPQPLASGMHNYLALLLEGFVFKVFFGQLIFLCLVRIPGRDFLRS